MFPKIYGDTTTGPSKRDNIHLKCDSCHKAKHKCVGYQDEKCLECRNKKNVECVASEFYQLTNTHRVYTLTVPNNSENCKKGIRASTAVHTRFHPNDSENISGYCPSFQLDGVIYCIQLSYFEHKRKQWENNDSSELKGLADIAAFNLHIEYEGVRKETYDRRKVIREMELVITKGNSKTPPTSLENNELRGWYPAQPSSPIRVYQQLLSTCSQSSENQPSVFMLGTPHSSGAAGLYGPGPSVGVEQPCRSLDWNPCNPVLNQFQWPNEYQHSNNSGQGLSDENNSDWYNYDNNLVSIQQECPRTWYPANISEQIYGDSTTSYSTHMATQMANTTFGQWSDPSVMGYNTQTTYQDTIFNDGYQQY